MTDKRTQAEPDHGNMEKDPADWVTGDEPMTGAQKSYLKTLSEEAKVDFDEGLSKAEASKRIDALQHKTGRGLHPKPAGDDASAQWQTSGAANPADDDPSDDGTTMSVGPE